MSPKIILTLVLSFVITCFSIFNGTPVELNLFGFKVVQLPLSFFLFLVFLIGAVYAAILTFYDQLQKAAVIKKLKRKLLDSRNTIEDLHTVIEKQEKLLEKQTDPKESAVSPVPEESEKEEVETPQESKKNDVETREKPQLEVVDPHVDTKGELTPELREFALKRIQNG